LGGESTFRFPILGQSQNYLAGLKFEAWYAPSLLTSAFSDVRPPFDVATMHARSTAMLTTMLRLVRSCSNSRSFQPITLMGIRRLAMCTSEFRCTTQTSTSVFSDAPRPVLQVSSLSQPFFSEADPPLSQSERWGWMLVEGGFQESALHVLCSGILAFSLGCRYL
jgi:hypothetical protein